MVFGKFLKQLVRQYEGKIDYEEVELDYKKLVGGMGIRVGKGQVYIEFFGNMRRMEKEMDQQYFIKIWILLLFIFKSIENMNM